MRVLVGTLYSGENEFDECVAAIKGQTFTDFDHLVIRNLPKREAHRVLFTSFVENASEYSLLIKVDADMVPYSDAIFERIVEKMTQSPDLDVLGVGVQDFFTGRLINGLNTFRNTVRWDFDKVTLFTDTPELDPDRYCYDGSELAPAAIHCKNPSPLQAFHYGVHRGLKSIARIHSSSHWAGLQSTWENFRKTGDVRVGLAVLGAELVYAGRFVKADADYTNHRMKAALEQYSRLGRADVEREIRRLRARNWGVLPGDLRRKLIRSLRGAQV